MVAPTESGSSENVEALLKRVQQMKEEAEALARAQEEVEEEMKASTASKEDSDRRSVFVGNVDYGTQPEELQQFFSSCGSISRVTILCDKYTSHPRGCAYVEFAEESGVENALLLNEQLFRNRPLKVVAKRTNLPGLARGRGRARRGRRGRRSFN